MARTSVANQLAAIRKQRELLNKKEEALKSKSHEKILAQIVSMAKDSGLTAQDIEKAMGSTKPSKAKRGPKAGIKSSLAGKKVPPKYRNPANHEQTWTGRGVAPLWFQELRKSGSIEAALIAPVSQDQTA